MAIINMTEPSDTVAGATRDQDQARTGTSIISAQYVGPDSHARPASHSLRRQAN